MMLDILGFMTGKSLIKSANECANAYAELESCLLQQGVKDATFLFNEPIVANDLVFEVEYNGLYGNRHEYSINIEYEQEDNTSWINFLLEEKIQDLQQFLQGVKNDKICIFNNEVTENNLYVGEYPHLMVTIPWDNFVRFIMIALEDCASNEIVLTDILVDKNIFIEEFSKALTQLKY